jgi:hypothetical protein
MVLALEAWLLTEIHKFCGRTYSNVNPRENVPVNLGRQEEELDSPLSRFLDAEGRPEV